MGDIVSKKRSNGLEKKEIGGKTGMIKIGSANYWYAIGGSCIAIGCVAMSLGPATGRTDLLILYLVSGVIIFIAGLSMINGAYIIERESKKTSVCLRFKELRHTNNCLYYGLFSLRVWVIFVAFTLLWFLYDWLFAN